MYGLIPPYLLNPVSGAPAVNFDFTSGALDSSITFTRGTTGNRFNSSGLLVSEAINAPRFDYGPSTLTAQGLLAEQASTNFLPSNSIAGATPGVIGSGGVLPTGWVESLTSAGLTVTVDTGTELGIPYLELRVAGTPSVSGGRIISWNAITDIASVVSNIWVSSLFARLVSGTLSNVSLRNFLVSYDGASTILSSVFTAISPTTAALTTQRFSRSYTIPDATAAYVRNYISPVITTGLAVDFTLRIGLMQSEKTFLTSAINTSAGSVSRSADLAKVTSIPWFTPAQGTFYVEAIPYGLNSSGNNQTLLALSDGTTSNYWQLRIDSAGTLRVSGVGGTPWNSVSLGTMAAYGVEKLAFAWTAAGSASVSRNGAAAVTTAGPFAFPAAVSQMDIGNLAGNFFLNGTVRSIKFWNTRKTDAELAGLTA